ncbi:aspartate/glutamate racemase family protein [Sporosarcina sp. P33]|uniref:aspartate/glutamate racemase family protein n=1 Tax=Sporosarcina sp. P33 TaxID=1930764 RepID=UPI0009C17D15|nr:aspartate/glutamate racemase family protein [Sporosarcina sp. P33]ARD49065.1 Asp/Glu/hydantoin racemase [Sporosarcina sp. P33]
MTTKIGLIHATMNSVDPILKAFRERHPDVVIMSFMDESLIFELNETNTITHNMTRRLMELVSKAEEAGVDAILLTCSSFSPYVDKFKHLYKVPVLSSDESMLKKAISLGSTIGVIATVKKAGPTTTSLLEEYSKEINKDVTISTSVITEAFQALQNGNPNAHDKLILEEISSLEGKTDVIILAQYSMSRVINSQEMTFSVPVLTGPEVGADAIVELARSAQ